MTAFASATPVANTPEPRYPERICPERQQRVLPQPEKQPTPHFSWVRYAHTRLKQFEAART